MRALLVDVLAQAPDPAPGQGGAKINVTSVAPPSSEKFTMLLGVGLWIATAALIGLGVLAGVKFAQAYADGHAGRSEKFMIVAVAIGAVISATSASYVSFFMN
ncbi:hypothetical protein GS504_03460 [Rhodococcus hoagii]|nr:hypothetical protein [Prescottella equi]NKS56614.1 hypothetical protein [Prescottella equi]